MHLVLRARVDLSRGPFAWTFRAGAAEVADALAHRLSLVATLPLFDDTRPFRYLHYMALLQATPYLLDEERAPRVLEAAHKLDDEVRLLRQNGALDAVTLARLRTEWGYKQIHESAGIEGNELSLSETEIAIQRGITISGKPPEHSREVQNLFNAVQYAEHLAQGNTPITEWEIRELQSLIVGRDVVGAGAYRAIEVEITNSPHKPPHPIVVPEQMAQFAAWLAAAAHLPVPLQCAVAHAWFVYIHPFTDGNGRTARALSNLLLIRGGYPIVVVRRKDRQRYYEALRASDNSDITPFLELIVDRCQDSLRQIDRIRQATVGISLAVLKVKETDLRRFELWAAGIRLFATTFASLLKDLEAALGCSVVIQDYDMPSVEDYQALEQGSADGNTWLQRITVTRAGETRSLLLWIGFSSKSLMTMLNLGHPIPAIKMSQPNDSPPPAWIEVDAGFVSSAREFAYHEGKFTRMDQQRTGLNAHAFDNVQVLCAQFVRELIEGWFARPVSG